MAKRHPIRPFLKAWRNHFGYTQQALAERIGTVHSTVQRAEAGEAGVDDATFAEIARVYGITVSELSAHPSERVRAKALDDLLTTVRDMTPEQIAALAALAKTIGKP